VTLELGRLFRVGQQITQIIGRPGGYQQTLHRVVVGVHVDRVDVVTHGASDWGTDSFRLGEPVTSAFTIESLLPPRVGILDKRPWPRTTRALRHQVSLILESQVLDGAWCTSTDSDSQPAKVVHVFVPKWSAPLPHVLDILRCYLPYEGAEIDYGSVIHGDISRIITITRPEEPSA
jgi:hypothetical protein